MPDCKTVECCDLDDFQETSSSEGNCPAGWYWNGSACALCDIPIAPSLAPSSGQIQIDFNVGQDLPYRLEKLEGSNWMVLVDSLGIGADSYIDTTTVAGETYSYRIVVEQSSDCGYIEGESASAVAI